MADARVTACTIVARNYLPAAKVLARSYLAHHPGNDFVIAVIDAHDEAAEQNGFRVVGREAFGIAEDDYLRMATAYSVTELATSVKPYLLRELRREYDVAIYLDPDIQVFAPMPEVAELAMAHGIVLTPHVLAPLPRDGYEPDEAVIMGAGIFNLGFIGVGAGSAEFLDFWAERLKHDAIVAPEQQLFTDQRWVDNVPALFPHHVLRDPGFNVAYWNLHERALRREPDGRLTADGAELRFFHFSGYRPETPWLLTMYCPRKPRVMLSANPDLRALCDSYGAALRSAGYAETLEAVPYGFLGFGDGMPLPKLARRAFREAWIKAERKKKPLPPHAYGEDGGEALRTWLAEPGDEAQAAAGLNRMTLAVWEARVDLRAAFPDPTGANAEAFRAWCVSSGISEGELAHWAVPGQPAALRAPVDEFGVNLLGYLTAELGVGEMGRIVHEAIEAAGIPVASVLEERSVLNRTGLDRPATVGDPKFPISVLAVNADMTRPLLGAHREVGHDRYRIGLWAWELEDFPAELHPAFGLLDEVWTVSDFCRTAIAKHSPIPVKTIPVPVRDPGEPARAAREPGEPVRFLFAFDFNSIAQRKNPWGAVTAFQKAFPGRDDVRLTIKTINSERRPVEAERLRAAVADDDRIELLERYLSVDELHELYARSTCYVSLHRSEGFGLTVAEAMARAMPVISTDYSSTTEFLDERTGWPVPYRLVQVGKNCEPYGAESLWAEPDLDAAAAAMRQVADDPVEADRRGRQAREHILRTRSMAAAAEWMKAELETAYHVWQSRRAAQPHPPEHPLAPLRAAAEALRWRPEADAPARVPLAPALRKAVLRAIDHYDVHQRRVMGALREGTEDTTARLLARIESIESRLDDAQRAAETGRRVSERIEAVKGSVDKRLNALESSFATLRGQAPDTELALRNLEADLAKLADGFGELQANATATHHMFEARDQRLDQDEEALERVSVDAGALLAAARLAHAPVPSGADVVPCDVGALLMPVDEVMLPWITFHRSWEDTEAELMARLAGTRPGAVLDVGAHVGYHTLRLLRSCPEVTRVVAVEAHPVNAEYLRRNLRVNLPAAAAELTTVLEAAAWDGESTLRLTESAGNSGDNRVSAGGPGTEVRALRLDDVPEVGAQPVALIKVDLQGRDHRALAGLAETLRRDRPHVVCEFCPSAIEELGDDPAVVLAGYRELGYRLVEVGENGVDDRSRDDAELIERARRNQKEFSTLWLDPRVPAHS